MQKIEAYVSVQQPVAKLGLAWLATLGVNSMQDMAHLAATVASIFAALYTLCLLIEFVWRKWTRPCLERRGLIKRIRRRRDDPPQRRTSSDSDIDA